MKKAAPVESFCDLIALWPSLSAFSADIGVPYVNGQQMRRRDSIAPAHWPEVIAAAERQGFRGITKELLAELAMARALERAAS